MKCACQKLQQIKCNVVEKNGIGGVGSKSADTNTNPLKMGLYCQYHWSGTSQVKR